jgi:aryl-alcohol dehydrogenase-like predicted oxidoreductase
MQYTTLSTTDIKISRICLGTMSYGNQLTEAEGHQQLSRALELGVNFVDTAEMYPVPPAEATYSITESIIGRWIKKTGNRDQIVLASKILGPNRYPFVRNGNNRLDKKNLEAAVDASLRRLQTDWIDLYQLHWPDRNMPFFGQRGYVHQDKEQATPIEETLEALATIVKTGKIRHVGLSNESPWGTMKFLQVAKEKNLPRMVSIQNVYNLINRHYDVGLAEISMREEIGLLAYSPLGYGILGGRYFDGNLPPRGRFTVHPEFAIRYRSPKALAVTKLYADLAKRHGMSLAQMALAFLLKQPWVTSVIIGASTPDQLEEDVGSIDVKLSDEVIKGIEAIHEEYPNTIA